VGKRVSQSVGKRVSDDKGTDRELSGEVAHAASLSAMNER
jgi:hypothetical protein